jgi:hypothetical protein
MAGEDKLRAVLDKKLILEDEKKMWQEAGFFVEEPAFGYIGAWGIWTQTANDKILPEVARDIRSHVIAKWEETKKKRAPEVRLTEDENYRESLVARNET